MKWILLFSILFLFPCVFAVTVSPATIDILITPNQLYVIPITTNELVEVTSNCTGIWMEQSALYVRVDPITQVTRCSLAYTGSNTVVVGEILVERSDTPILSLDIIKQKVTDIRGGIWYEAQIHNNGTVQAVVGINEKKFEIVPGQTRIINETVFGESLLVCVFDCRQVLQNYTASVKTYSIVTLLRAFYEGDVLLVDVATFDQLPVIVEVQLHTKNSNSSILSLLSKQEQRLFFTKKGILTVEIWQNSALLDSYSVPKNRSYKKLFGIIFTICSILFLTKVFIKNR
ncbi:MAG: hypothetical protein ACI8Y7_000943 [Candidatus Woesearchaeota archaeon]|jgi:hypothetical protein